MKLLLLIYLVFLIILLCIICYTKEPYLNIPYEARQMTRLGSDVVSGSVWTTPNYDTGREDPGLSWIL